MRFQFNNSMPGSHCLLLVDDDLQFGRTLDQGLREAGFTVAVVASPAAMHAALARRSYAAVLIELRLGDVSGLSLIGPLRAAPDVPILMISGRSDESDRVSALELGADDFLAKPAGLCELQARLHAVLRRYAASATAPPPDAAPGAGPAGRSLAFGPWVLDLGARELHSRDGVVRNLTCGEFRLLEIFVGQPRQLLTRDELIDRTRRVESEVYDRSIDIVVLRLRRKIEPDPRHPQFIGTERGQGYIFNAEVTPVVCRRTNSPRNAANETNEIPPAAASVLIDRRA